MLRNELDFLLVKLPCFNTRSFFCARCCCCLLDSFLFISIFNHSHLAAWKMIYTPISVNYTLSVPIFHIHKYSHNSFQWLAEPKIVSLFLFLSSSLTTHESKYYNTKYIHFNMYFECYCCYYYNFNFINCVWCMYLPSFFFLWSYCFCSCCCWSYCVCVAVLHIFLSPLVVECQSLCPYFTISRVRKRDFIIFMCCRWIYFCLG